MLSRFITCCLLLAGLFPAAQQTPAEFTQLTRYQLYLPPGYAADTSQRWPVMLFLHGSGESGDDVQKVKVNGPPKLIEAGKQYPFIVVSPQAASSRTGFQPSMIKALLDELKQKFRIDPDRVYLTGLSMGGYASWKIAQEYPEEFAAVIPVCGGGDSSLNWKLRYMPVWNFHGGKDVNVPISESEQMMKSLRLDNPTARFTVYPEVGHNSWEQAYDTDSLYTWMLAQRRFRFKPMAIDAALLKKFEGRYAFERDTFDFRVSGSSLQLAHIQAPNDQLELKCSAPGHFYIREDMLTELVFPVAGTKANGFTVFDRNERKYFRRIR